ncbi:MAG: SUMF1/EgtB/PvdO family nonheme iron enzyme [Chloroflexota bacterium]
MTTKSTFVVTFWILIAFSIIFIDQVSRADVSRPNTNRVPTATSVPATPLGSIPVDLSPMVHVPASLFIMGPHRQSEQDTPTSNYIFENGFYIDPFEVTVNDYATFLNQLEKGHIHCSVLDCTKMRRFTRTQLPYLEFIEDIFHVKPGTENLPIIGIDWDSAQTYCKFQGKNLPTETQWEKAARGSEGLRYPWGNSWTNGRSAGYSSTDWPTFPAPVGSYPTDVSPYGVYDMLGNATEWVADRYAPPPGTIASAQSPYGPNRRFSRINRGALREDARLTGLLTRSNGRSKNVGFRCTYTPS